MTKKEWLRKGLMICFCLYIFYTIIMVLLGRAETLEVIVTFIFYCLVGSLVILLAILKMISKVQNFRHYKVYEKSFQYLLSIHKARYSLYFRRGTKDAIEIYSAEIDRIGNALLIGVKYDMSHNSFTKKQAKRAQEILDQTTKMLATVK